VALHSGGYACVGAGAIGRDRNGKWGKAIQVPGIASGVYATVNSVSCVPRGVAWRAGTAQAGVRVARQPHHVRDRALPPAERRELERQAVDEHAAMRWRQRALRRRCSPRQRLAVPDGWLGRERNL
jgi:hypothetical protein